MAPKDVVSTIKDGAAGVREIALVVLLGVLLFNPPVLVGWLQSSQLDKVGVFGISFEARKVAEASRDQSLIAANQLQAVEERAKLAEAKVTRLAAALAQSIPPEAPITTGSPPQTAATANLRALAKQVDSVRREIAGTRVAAQRAQVSTQKAVIAQTRAVQKAGGAARSEGWVWAGQIDPLTGKLRNVGEPETVATSTLDPDRLKGSEVRFQATTYIYREPFDGASQPTGIIGVAPAGKTATATEARLMKFRREGLARRDPNDQILWVRIGPG